VDVEEVRQAEASADARLRARSDQPSFLLSDLEGAHDLVVRAGLRLRNLGDAPEGASALVTNIRGALAIFDRVTEPV
jgi:hypothetical protein